MKVSLIAALTIDRIIGKSNSIPWILPDDLKWFKYHTLNKPIIMGRLTFESIGKPLPNRWNIVVSKNQPIIKKGITWVNSLRQALLVATEAAEAEEIMIIGGGNVYEQMIKIADRLYLTHVYLKVKGDTIFPEYKPNEWHVIFTEFHAANEKNIYNYCFEILDRRL
ncbi:type 3 dihydrofolate reductase [Candidatus Ishikawella capsulata]|nr:type 3 dihydrofolate reductase [Candidatus Ishikawaella capsulata]